MKVYNQSLTIQKLLEIYFITLNLHSKPKVRKVFTRIYQTQFYQRIRHTDIFRTLIHSQNYFLARIVTLGLAFITLPIFTRILTVEDYGIVSVYNAYVGIATVLFSANIHGSVARYYYEDKSDFSDFLGTTLVLILVTFPITTSIFLLFLKEFTALMNLPTLLPLLLILSGLFGTINSTYIQLIVAQRKSLEFAIVSVLSSFFSIILAIIFILSLNENRYLGQIIAYLSIALIFSIYFMSRILSNARITFRKRYIKYILAFSIPLIPYYLSSNILAFFDRIMINITIDSAAAGVYSLGYNIGMLLSIVISATQAALMPDFYNFLNTKQYLRLDVLIRKVFSLITIAALTLILFTDEIVLILVAGKFQEGKIVVPIVVVSYIFYGMYEVYGRYIGYVKKTFYSSLAFIISGLTNIILNAIFIPQYGYIAAAYTTAISYFILFLINWFITNLILKLKTTPLLIIWKPTILFFLILFVFPVFTMQISNFLLLIIIKIIIISLFGFLLFHRELKKLFTPV